MSHRRRSFALRHPVVVDIGCKCRRPKLPSFFLSSPKDKRPKSPTLVSPSSSTSLCDTSLNGATAYSSSSSSFSTTTTITTTAMRANSSCPSPPLPSYFAESGIKKRSDSGAARKGVVEGSTVVVKDSSEPYLDFLESMLQMIVEMEIYAWDDLRDLLHRFLALNAPHHHRLILRAFTEIWNGVFAAASPSAGASASPSMRLRR